MLNDTFACPPGNLNEGMSLTTSYINIRDLITCPEAGGI